MNGAHATLLPLVLLVGTPGIVSACSMCFDLMAYDVFPKYHSMVGVLLGWLVVHTVIRVWAMTEGGMRSVLAEVLRNATIYLAVGFLVFLGSAGSVGVVALGLLGYFGLWVLRDAANLKRVPRSARIMTGVTLVLLIVLARVGVIEERNRDYFAEALAMPEVELDFLIIRSREITRRPEFEVERLRPLLVSSEEKDQTWAIGILWARCNAEDLVRFEEEIAQLPPGLFDRANARGSDLRAIYLQYWLKDIKAEEMIVGEEPERRRAPELPMMGLPAVEE